ncbi:MAG: peptidoglycan DD-metalloendopeptidase family protein [Paludibacteraceae bacterium]|nr:peptidoglycan DD-metalloendopeptidase family protein [Paludibacteraceae bacterium]
MKIILLILFTATLFVGCNGSGANEGGGDNDSTQVVEDPRTIQYGVDVTDLDEVQGKVANGQIITSLLRNLGADQKAITQAAFIPESVFDVRRMKAGNNYLAYYTQDSVPQLVYLVYQHSVTDFIVFHFEDSLHVEQFIKPTILKTRTGEFVVETSLWNAIVDADMNMELALQLSDVYAWTVDFFGLQKGDGFKVYYDELFVDSVSIGISKIHAASYKRGDKELFAVFYENDEVRGYWDLDGNNLKKAFLKAPLSFSRISSKFSYARKHPVHKIVRPHTGVDYAAPMGTPVMAIGDGVVTFKGYKGGGGHTVKIRHNSTYTSAYLHLSKYGKGVFEGARVSQGQVIGYVGSSGTSTGAHLDFRIWKNGTPIDPLKMESPPTEPIPANARAEFDSVKTVMLQMLDSIK